MGKIIEKIKLRNLSDIALFKRGMIKKEEIRSIDLEAQVDTGTALVCLPPDLIEKLGLDPEITKVVVTANGKAERRIFSPAEITIQDRTFSMPVMENDRTTPPLIGYLILEAMDWVIDMKTHRLIGNPAHEGKWVIDLL